MHNSNFKAGLLAGIILPAASFLAPLASADDSLANPVLIAKNYFNNDTKVTSRALEVTQLDLVVSLLPGYAETTATMTFYNPTNAQLEGEFLLDLPTDSIIIGYGLDIEGEMIDGVLVEKKKAKKAFESRIRRGIDPGLAEMTRENAFKTRIFPILPQSSRTIKVSFLSPISAAQPYRLPLNSDTPIKDLSVTVSAEGFATRPAVSLPGQMRFNWGSDSSNGTANGHNIKPQGALTITPQGEAGYALERHANGERFLSVTMDAPEVEDGKDPKTIRVYWDTSLSSSTTTAQQQVLFETLLAFDKAKIDLIPFASAPRGEASLNRISADAAISAIGDLNYNGATNLEALYASEAGRRSADICLLITDGRATLGSAPLATLPCKTFTLSGAEDADRGVLQMLAQRSGGQFIDTRAINADQLQQILTSDTPYLKSLKIDGREHKAKAIWSSDGDQLRLVVPVHENSRRVNVDFGTISATRRFSAMPAYTGKRLGAVWANHWLVQVAASGADRDELVALSQTYSVASEVTSFLVLETVQDYVASRVALPITGFSKTQRAEYAELIANAEAQDRNARETRLASVIDDWKSQIEWYEASYQWTQDNSDKKTQANLREETGEAQPVPPPSPLIEQGNLAPEEDEARQDSIAVTGSRRELNGFSDMEAVGAFSENDLAGSDDGSNQNASQSVTAAIEIKPWSPDRPYLEAVKDQCGDGFETEYYQQRPEYGTLPSFYLEMADARARCGDTAAAAEIALSALELDAANTDTMSAVANRLLSYGKIHLAVELFTQITDDDPDRPQTWRDLALALELQAQQPGLKKRERRALYEQAIEHLNHVIETPWDGDYDGVELISVMEANRITERLRGVDGAASLPDPELERLLDVDLRIVVTWNIDDVDMDLWVNEPTGERSYYGYALTQIGGRISNDMTAGYGPEEYLLKQALPGEYSIEMNYYSSDIINPNGAVTLRAHIYRNWGRADESVSVVDLEFTNQANSNYLVAELTVQ